MIQGRVTALRKWVAKNFIVLTRPTTAEDGPPCSWEETAELSPP